MSIRNACVALLLVSACVADEADLGDESAAATVAAPSQSYTLTSRLWKDLQVVVTRTHQFTCFPGWTYTEDYQLRYPVCVRPLPAHCTDTYRITHRCVDGAFRVVSNVLVSHVCDYDYDGRSCGPIEWP
jgi:hypothetical protein